MASIVGQYEKETSISAGYPVSRSLAPEMTTAGIIDATLEDETPIFSKQRINFHPTDPISHLVVSNNIVVLAMKNKVLLRIDVRNAECTDEMELSRFLGDKSYQARLYQLFLDPTGRHLLASIVYKDSNGPFENVYIWHNSRKIQSVAKSKGHVISAVGWNFLNASENSSSHILVGTSKGLVFETELMYSDDRSFFSSYPGPEQYWKQVFDFKLKNEGPITGLEFHRFSGSSSVESKYFVIVTTPSRLYQFMGSVPMGTEPPVLNNIFISNAIVLDRYLDLPGNLDYSKLQFFYPKSGSFPKSFAWMIEPGVFCGGVDNVGQAAPNYVVKDTRLLKYGIKGDMKPLSMVLTEFHVLVLFQDRLKINCVLFSNPDDQIVLEDVFTDTYGPMVGLSKDPITGMIWAFSELAVYKFQVSKEDRYVWEIYLNWKDYKQAKIYCKGDQAKLDKVLSKEAEDCFNKKKYEESAMLYAQTHNSFEDVALKFLEVEQDDALKIFLARKLEGLKPQDKTQTTMLVMWLIEVFLTRLGNQRSELGTEGSQKLQEDFELFLQLPRVKECLTNNRGAVYNLIASHGDETNLIHFAILMKDFERVIQYHLQHKNCIAALDILTQQSRSELFYQFSPALMQAVPVKTVDAWISQGRRLNPSKLIPSLVQYEQPQDSRQTNQAIRYLEFCIYDLHNVDEAIHNYLLALYARKEPVKLMSYLQVQGQDALTICYDLKYALRLCSDLQLHEACVHIYSTMGLFEEAVDLSLKVDIELAKRNADKPEDSDELRKKLWLKIAKHVVKEKNDIKRAMEFLKECDLIKIEDVLPFFPDFVTIDHFKDAICSSLQDYNHHIEGLKDEMEEATQSAQEIRSEIQTFRKKYAVVKDEDTCSQCSYSIMTRAFYLFPCKHMFHSDCLVGEVVQNLLPARRNRVEEIQKQLSVMSGKDDTVSLGSAVSITVTSTRDNLLAELDDLVASECLFCGDIMIKSVDAPFIAPEEFNQVMRGWE